jgi:uncharacterized protein involved in exopolysaccharide biosynthesis
LRLSAKRWAERDTAVAQAQADARAAAAETARAQQGEASARAELEHARAKHTRERDQLTQAYQAQITTLEARLGELVRRAGPGHAPGPRRDPPHP